MLILLAGLAVFLLLLEMPIAFSILGDCISFILLDPNINFSIIPNMIIQGMDSFILMAVPLFVLVGVIMSTGGKILIGPEGDFTPHEIKTAMNHHYLPVTLGETRLRTETAGVVAATLLVNK